MSGCNIILVYNLTQTVLVSYTESSDFLFGINNLKILIHDIVWNVPSCFTDNFFMMEILVAPKNQLPYVQIDFKITLQREFLIHLETEIVPHKSVHLAIVETQLEKFVHISLAQFSRLEAKIFYMVKIETKIWM